MFKIKKGNRLNCFLLLFTAVILIGVCYLSLKDVFLSEQECFEIAQQSDFKKEYKKAEKYYLLSSKSDNENLKKISWYYLGLLYKNKNAFNVKNFQKAKDYLEKSADFGLPQAQYELALLYDTGDKIKEDRQKAIYYMQKAAEQGYVDAEYGLAVFIERGYLGSVDMKKVVALYEKAAQKSHKLAIKGLILIYKMGSMDVLPDKEKADYWIQKLQIN